MTAQMVATAAGSFEVTGTGYDPHGGFAFEGREIAPADYPVLEELARAAMLCNDASLVSSADQWTLQGDPTEGALLSLGLKAGLNHSRQLEEWPRTDVIPFESEHRFLATLHHDHAGHSFVYLKGAPERVLEMCAYQRMRGERCPLDHIYWQSQMEAMAGRGQRLLAIAFRTIESAVRDLRFDHVDSGLTLLGVVGIIDPPREEAITAVAHCRAAGIRVKMITGDHARTAAAIAERMGIGDGASVMTGREIDALDDAALSVAVLRTDVFARTSPEHKLRLVSALQAAGQVVAMTGDGVNDAPALKRADVGIAMGHKGTEVAKEASEMVLADDNFASIASAIEEGRTVYDNLKKAILFILPTNGGEALILMTAIVLGRLLPVTPVQILWVNMITAVTLGLAFAFEPAESKVMARPPRSPAEPLLSRLLVWRVVFVSLILVAGTFGLFVWVRDQGASIEYARTVAVNALVVSEIFYLFSARYLTAPALSREGLCGNRYALLAIAVLAVFQIIFTYIGPAQRLFHTQGLDLGHWAAIIAVGATVLVLVELEKLLLRRAARRGMAWGGAKR
jgi:calcium-translocating P-type ATPase